MRLLELPAEIRNHIYEYVLTAPPSPGLRYRELTSVSSTPGSFTINLNGGTFNTLQFICRQLRHETEGLELQFNALIFEQQDATDFIPTELFHRFSNHASDAQSRRLSTATVVAAEGILDGQYEHLVALAQWCKQHPNVTLKYMLYDFCLPDPASYAPESMPWGDACEKLAIPFLYRGIEQSLALRGVILPEAFWTDALSLDLEHVQDYVRYWHRGWKVEDLEVTNLRFMPDVQMGEKTRIMVLRMLAEKLQVGEGVLEEWVDVTGRWVERGI